MQKATGWQTHPSTASGILHKLPGLFWTVYSIEYKINGSCCCESTGYGEMLERH